MFKKLIIILCCCFCFFFFIYLSSSNCKKSFFKEGDKVAFLDGTIGIVNLVTKEDYTYTYIYHVEVYNKEKKGYIVYRMAEKDVFEFIEDN